MIILQYIFWIFIIASVICLFVVLYCRIMIRYLNYKIKQDKAIIAKLKENS